MPYQLTIGQWLTLSPDYKRVDEHGALFFLEVHDDLSTELVPVEIVRVPVPVDRPEHYKDWPLDPRD